MKSIDQFKRVCEVLEGHREEPAPSAPSRSGFLAWTWRGLWWGLLAAGILLFSGQTSKFIYIDF